VKEFQSVIYKFLKNHEKHKRYIALLTVLSLIVSVAVPFSLIMPAISMTDPNAPETVIDNSNLLLLGAGNTFGWGDTDVDSSELDTTYMTVEINKKQIYNSINPPTQSVEVDGNTANLSVYLQYKFKEVNTKLSKLDGAGPHIVFENVIEGVSSVAFDTPSSTKVWDPKYSTSLEAGTFNVTDDGKIEITLTPTYRQSIKDKGSTEIMGSLSFSGEVSRAEDENGDQKVNIGGQEVHVTFKDHYPTITKEAAVNSTDGTIEWTITINNTHHIDLASLGYTLTDTMSGDILTGTEVTFEPAGVGTRGSDGTISFNNGDNAENPLSKSDSIKIKYKTKITDAQIEAKKAENIAKLFKPGKDTPVDEKTGFAWLNKPIEVSKSGVADYKSEGTSPDGSDIKWTITLKNTYGISLNGYKISDNMLSKAVSDVKVITPSGGSVDKSTGVLSNVDNAKEIKIEYWAPAEEGKDNTNAVKVLFPNDKDVPDTGTSQNVHYAKKPDINNVTKNGSYNPDTHKITWTVNVKSDDGMSLKDYTLTDTQFPADFSGFNFSSCKYHYADKTPSSVISYDAGSKKITFTGDADTVTFTYTTDAPQDILDNAKATVVNNDIGFGGTTTAKKTETVQVSGRKTITKTAVSKPKEEQIKNDTVQETIGWETFITFDGKFNNTVVLDTPSVSDAEGNPTTKATHKYKDKSVKVYAGTYSNNLQEVDPSNYTLEQENDGYKITFKEGFDSGNVNYVKITYDTVITIPKGDDSYGKYVFNNSANFDNGTVGPGPGVNIEKINPVLDEKTDLPLTKTWNTMGENYKKAVTFKIKYSVNNNGEWKYLKGSENNILYDGDNGYASAKDLEITFDGDKSSNIWTHTLKNLRKKTAKEGAGGVRDDYREYQYKIEEVKIDGKNVIQVNNDRIYYQIADGVYIGTIGANNATNGFYPNTKFTAIKEWMGDDKEANKTSDKKIKVRLEYSPANDGKWYPVRKSADGKYQFTTQGADVADNIVTAEITKNNSWQFSWNDLPSQIIVGTPGEPGAVVQACDYRIIEIEVDGHTINYTGDLINDKTAKVPVDGGYYAISYEGNKQVNNKFVKSKGLSIEAGKSWSGDDNNQSSRPSEIKFKLQQQADNGTWKDYPDSVKTLTAESGWSSVKWENLPNQAVVDGKVVIYNYKVVECGYIFDGKEVSLADTAKDFATLDGYYEMSNSPSHSINVDDSVTITNTFKKFETIDITPQKNWAGDTALDSNNHPYKDANRPTEIVFTLQRSLNGTDWENVKGTINAETGVFTASNNDNDIVTVSLSTSGADQMDSDGFEIWKGKQIKGLPKSVIQDNIIKDYQYRFVETSYKYANQNAQTIADDATSFKTPDGEYKANGDNPISSTGIFNIKNEFKENIGTSKTALDKNAKPIDSLTIDDLKDYKYKLEDGKEYYIFNWMIEIQTKDETKITPFLDILPEGFTLLEDSNYYNAEVNITWSGGKSSILDPLKDGGAPLSNKNGYYYLSPCITWVNVGCNTVKKESSYSDAWANPGVSPSRYYYDSSANKIYFGIPYNNPGQIPVYTYSAKIECKDLEAKLKNGSFTISNKVEMYDKEGKNPTGREGIAKLEIKKPSQLISKDYKETGIPGYIDYTIDVNPDGQNLSNGSTIDIEDIFKTKFYRDNCEKGNGQKKDGSNLVDVIMNNIELYEVDANGNETKLTTNQYVLQFEGTGTDKSALLKLTIPDETHIRIKYTYKLIANENTPSVINGCESNVRVFGSFDTMKPGYVPPIGDEIGLTNTAKIIHDGLEENSKPCDIDYLIDDSGASIEVNDVPRIVKVNTGDYTIKNLVSSFYFAKYESDKKWYFASDINSDNGAITWDSEGYSDDRISSGAKVIDISKTKDANNKDVIVNPKVAVESGILYKLIEIKFPEDYEGSNLGLSETDFKTLITNYINSNITSLNGKDYGIFLRNYVATHYFVYNTNSDVKYNKPDEGVTSNPNKFRTENVMQVLYGYNIEIPNSELIDIKVSKEWWKNAEKEPDKEDAKITVKLWWSYTKADSKPADAEEATALSLGIIDKDYDFVKTISASSSPTEAVWKDLPNGKNNKPIYYYVEELKYYVNGTNYDANKGVGEYSPIYVGNAINSDGTVTIKNTSSLIIKKDWKKSNNNPMTPVEKSIKVSIYGTSKADGDKVCIIDNLELTKEKNWIAKVENISGDISAYERLEVVETPDMSNEYTVSCVFNVNDKNVGEIVVTNKNKKATDASVSVKKVWSDGETVHKNDSITVSLWQSEKELTELATKPELLTKDYLEAKGAVKVTASDDIQNPVTLNAESETPWTYTWKSLPIYKTVTNAEGVETETDTKYYYYVLEDSANFKDSSMSDKYTSVCTVDEGQTLTRTDYTIKNIRHSITVNKKWFDENGREYSADKLKNDRDEVAFKVYKYSENKPETVKFIAFGDSITNGYDGGGDNCSKNGKDYPSKLVKLLEDNGYNVSNDTNVNDFNKGVSQQQIGKKSSDGFRSRVTSDIPSDTNIICFLGGTNDIHQSGDAQGNPDEVYRRFEACISEIQTQTQNKAVIFVGSIPHFDFYKNGKLTDGGSWWPSNYQDNDGKTANDLIDQYNAEIKKYAAGKDNVVFVDICSVVTDNYIRTDGCHPNDEGYTAIANAYYSAIDNYYKDYLAEGNTFTSNVSNAKVFTAAKVKDWTTVVDLPSGSDYTYYIEEVNQRNNWKVEYKDNGQTPGSDTQIIMENHYTPAETTIKFTKTWVNDSQSDDDNRSQIKLRLFRRPVDKNTHQPILDKDGNPVIWEQCIIPKIEGSDNPSLEKTGSKEENWIYTYNKLPATDEAGNPYMYKITEDALEGYTPSDGGESGEVLAEVGETEELSLRNTKTLSLTVKKEWSDGNDKHKADTVKVRVYRSTDADSNSNADIMFVVKSDKDIALSQGDTSQIETNKTSDVTYTSSNPDVATVSNTGLITAVAKTGTADITVKYGNQTEVIHVTVSELLSVSPNTVTIEGTQEKTLKVSNAKGDITITGGNSSIAKIEKVDNTQIKVTGVSSGTTKFTVKDTSDAPAVEVTVSVNPAFANTNANLEIFEGGTLNLTFNKEGTIKYNYNSSAISSIDNTGKVTANSVDSDATVEITATNETTGENCKFNVTVKNFAIKNGASADISKGGTLQLETNKTSNIEWSSSSDKFIVDSTGNVSLSGAEVGDTAVITAKIKGTEIIASITLTVKNVRTIRLVDDYYPNEQSKDLTSEVIVIVPLGETVVINTGRELKYCGIGSNNIADGKYNGANVEITGKQVGTTKVDVQTRDPYFARSFTVKVVQGLEITPAEAIIYCGESIILSSTMENTSYSIEGKDLGVTLESIGNKNKDCKVTAGNTTGTVTIKAVSGSDVKRVTITIATAPWSIKLGDEVLQDNTTLKFSINDTKEIVSNYPVTISGGDGKVTLKDEKTITITSSVAGDFEFTIHYGDESKKILCKVTDPNAGITLSDNTPFEITDIDSTKNTSSITFKLDKDYLSTSNDYVQMIVTFYDVNNNQIGNAIYLGGYNWSDESTTASIDGAKVAKITVTKSQGKKIPILGYTVNYVDAQTASLMSLAPMSLMLDSEPVPAPKETGIVWTDDGNKQYTDIEITATDNWQYILENLDVSDSSNNEYYYWVEELNANTSYEVSYRFEDGDEIGSDSDTLINSSAPGDSTAVIRNTYKESTGTTMPEAGGTGTRAYTVTGIAMISGAFTLLVYKKRRKRA